MTHSWYRADTLYFGSNVQLHFAIWAEHHTPTNVHNYYIEIGKSKNLKPKIESPKIEQQNLKKYRKKKWIVLEILTQPKLTILGGENRGQDRPRGIFL